MICKKPGYHRPPKKPNRKNTNTHQQPGVPRYLGEKMKHTRPNPLHSAVLLKEKMTSHPISADGPKWAARGAMGDEWGVGGVG